MPNVVTVEGLDQLVDRVTWTPELSAELADALAEESIALLDDMRGSGTQTAKGGRGAGFVPIDSGRLLNSLLPDVDGMRLEIYSSLDYAEFARFKDEEVGQMNEDLAAKFTTMTKRVGESWRETLSRKLGADDG